MEVHPKDWQKRANASECKTIQMLQKTFRQEMGSWLIVGLREPIEGRETDLIFGWRKGLFILEVKSWNNKRLHELLQQGANQFEVGGAKNPIDQADYRSFAFKGLLKKRNIKVYIGKRVVLPYLRSLDYSTTCNLGWRVAGEEYLVDGSLLDDSVQLRQALTLEARHWPPRADLHTILNTLKGEMRREATLDELADPAKYRGYLQPDQMAAVEWSRSAGLGQSLLLVPGAAGTGKTLVALHRAWRAAQKGKRVLYACCNRSLMMRVREIVSSYPELAETIDVYLAPSAILRSYGRDDFDALPELDEVYPEVTRLLDEEELYREYAEQIRKKDHDPVSPAIVGREVLDIWGTGAASRDEYKEFSARQARYLDFKGDEFYELCWAAAADLSKRCIAAPLLQECAQLSRRSFTSEVGLPGQRYDEIVVDEAQDAYPCWLEGMVPLLTKNGTMVVFYDRAQAVHRLAMPKIEEKLSMRFPAGSTTFPLRINHRYPRDIMGWYRSITDRDEPFEHEWRLLKDWDEPQDSSVEEGRGAVFHRVQSEMEAIERTRALVKEAVKDNYTCTVLYRGSGDADSGRRNNLDVGLVPKDCRNVVRASPLGTLRGLEFDHVILFGMNSDFPQPDRDEESLSQVRRRLQVAVTRVRFKLHIVYWSHEPSPDLARLRTERT